MSAVLWIIATELFLLLLGSLYGILIKRHQLKVEGKLNTQLPRIPGRAKLKQKRNDGI